MTRFKFIRLFFIASAVNFTLSSCGNDDDICTSGEATPRLKIKFKTAATGKIRTLDTLHVAVDYGNGPTAVLTNNFKTDSALIPIRVDENPFTDLFIKTSLNGNISRVRINYTTKNQYVSPACGIKRLYENINVDVPIPNPVINVEKNQNEILDENKTHIFLHF